MNKEQILVVGSSNLDYVINMENIPVVGETVMGTSFEMAFGGKGANQAYACARLGGNTCFLSAVGMDKDTDLMLQNFEKEKADISHILRLEQDPTGRAYIYVNAQGNNCIVVVSGANSSCTPAYLETCLPELEKANLVMLQMEIPQESVYYMIEQAYRLQKPILLNPAPAPDFIPDEILKKLDYITPNETELQKLTGILVEDLSSAKVAASTLIKKGVKNVIVTLGNNGALLVNHETCAHFPGKKVPVVDSTAAGDTFNAALAVYLTENHSIAEAIQFANYAGALSVSKKGAQSSVPKRSEVAAMIENK